MLSAAERGARAAVAEGGGAVLGAAGAMLVRCDAGGGSYCLEAARVAAIERADRLEVEPGEDGRLGWLPGAGESVPVYPLAACLGLAPPPGAPGPIVVVAGGGRPPWGLAVERVARVTAGAEPLVLPDAVRTAAGGRFTGAVPLGERLALVLAPDRLRPDDGAGAEAGEGAEARGESPPFHSSPSPGRAAAAAARPRAVMLFSAHPDGRQGATLFGLSLAQVEEVLRPVPVTPVPGAGDGLLGVVLWRDRVVPVIDLAHRAALAPPAAGPPGRLLLVRGVRHPGWVAFPVRADLKVEPLPLPSRAWADDPRMSPLAALGVFELAAGTVVVPDVDRILTPDRAGPAAGRAARSAPDERGESDEES